MNTLALKKQLQNGLYIPILALVLALLVVGGIIAYTLYREHGYIENRERERLATQAKVIDENLGRQLYGVYRALEGVRKEMPLWKGKVALESANHHLRTMADVMPGIRTIMITDAAGTIIACNREQVIGQNIRYREYFQAPFKGRNLSTLYISPPFKTILGNFVINVALMIPGEEEEFAGVVSAALDPEYFNILLGSVLYTADMWAALAHGDGNLFLRVPERKGVAGLDLGRPGTFFTRHRASGQLATVLTGTALVGGEERMMAQRTIMPSGLSMDKPLVVAVSRDLSALYADWRREAFGKGALFGVLVLATTLALYLYQQRQRKFEAIAANYEATQRDNADRLKLATEAAGVGVWDYDLNSGRLTWDDAMFIIFGKDPTGFSSAYEDWSETLLPEDRNCAEAAMQTAIDGGEPFNTSFRIIRGDGEVRTIRGVGRVHCNEDGKPVRMIGINEDITERQQEAEILRNKERFLNTLTNAVPNMVAYWTRGLRCTFANDEYRNWYGKSPDEILGIQLLDLIGEEQFRKTEPFINGVLKGEVQRFVRTMTRLDGEVCQVWAHFIPDVDGDLLRGFYVLISNITELKQVELQLEELNEVLKQRTEEAEQASRTKSRFLATVGHEFRTPLSLLTSSTDILDRYGERLSDEQRTEQHGHIRSAARQMSSLVDSVLSFNRMETDGPKAVPVLLDVGRICRAIATEVSTVWDTGQKFQVLIPDSGTAKLDEILLRRVLENLLTNAFRYTPTGGTVSLSVNQEREMLLMVISDNGIGIPEEDRQRIFDAFYRCQNVETRRGLGLGLSIVREALSLMGGTITVDSTLGKGTAMRVEIPLTNGSPSKERDSCIQS